MSGSRLVSEMIADADLMHRFANTWDGHTGAFTPRERAALLELAELTPGLVTARWAELNQHERGMLVFAAKRVIELGRHCARIADG